MTNLDDARRAYEAAKRLQDLLRGTNTSEADARLLLTNHEAEYRAALIDAAERRFDALGIRVGETTVIAKGGHPFIIGDLVADVPAGRVKAWSDSGGGWAYADELRPYTDAKQMVLYSDGISFGFWTKTSPEDKWRLTLSNVTPADLDAMTGPITGTYTLEKLK